MRKIPVSTADMYAVYQEGKSAAEVGAIFGLKPVTVKARFNREGYKMRSLSERTDRWYENIARAKQGNFTSQEKSFAEQFEALGIHVIHNYAVFRYNIDLAYLPKKIAFEIDNGNHRHFAAVRERDRKKDKYLIKRGWKVVRIQVWSGSRKMTGKIVVPRICRELGLI